MSFTSLDWVLIFLYFLLALVAGIIFSKKAGRDLESFFASGRSLPWWAAGTSMVATTFGADTPLAVTEIVSHNGISGNWLWWNMVMGGMLTVFLFSKLWRRSGVLTDVEFTELRYSGGPAAFLRGFRALYLGLPINCLIMAWSILAMSSILGVSFNFPKAQAIAISLSIAVTYSILSGLWGVVATDMLQFLIAMVGSISLAVISVQHVGGIEALKLKVVERHSGVLNFFPDFHSPALPFLAFLVYVGVQWWACWYPGSEPGGGGYIVQRMLATKDEKNSLFATLWFNIAHYALRPWPWILVALASLVVFPELQDAKMGYPQMMAKFIPAGLRGLMVASFFGAFMSTIDTHLNWGASYLINDFYRRFIRKVASPRHYVFVSRISVVLIMIFAGLAAYRLESIKGGWELLLSIGAGTGLVSIFRWYWWRVNAWSEISAMGCSFAVAMVLLISPAGRSGNLSWALRMLITAGVTFSVSFLVTLLTVPVEKRHLLKFYRKVKPAGFWGKIRKEAGEIEFERNLHLDLLNWLLGAVFVYGLLFGIGSLILKEIKRGLIYLLVAVISSIFLWRNITKKE